MSEYRDFGESESSTRLPRAGRNLVAVIGIDAYEHWGGLHNAVNDARGVRDTFEQLGFEVVGALFNGEATQHAIYRLVDDLEETVRSQDRLVVFFAGHGWSKPQFVANTEHHTGYLIPVDGSVVKNHAGSWVNVHELLRKLSMLEALHVLVVIDACNAGRALSKLFENGRGSGPVHEPFEVIHNKMSRMLIASALEDEVARDGGIEPDHSLFTTFLLEGLQGGEPAIDLGDGRRVVHGSALGQYVRHRVQCYDGDIGIRQNPGFGGFHLHKNGEMPIPLPRRIGDGTTTHLLPTYVLTSDPAFMSGGWSELDPIDDPVAPPPAPSQGAEPAPEVSNLVASRGDRSSPRLRRPTEPPPSLAPPLRPPPRLGTLAVAGVGAVMLGLVGIGLLVSSRTPATEQLVAELVAENAQRVQRQHDAVAPVASVPTPDPGPEQPEPTPPTPPPDPKKRPTPPPPRPTPNPKPSKCFVTIGVFPTGAEVVRDGVVIATPRLKDTPVPLPCKTPVMLTFRQPGWSTITKTVVATEEGKHVGAGLKYLGKAP